MTVKHRWTPPLIAPADVRRPIADWFRQHGVDPAAVPAHNTLSITGGKATFGAYQRDDTGWVVDKAGNRVVRAVTITVRWPFPPVNL